VNDALPRAHGGPAASGALRREADDFRVDEVLGFEPSGSGEHAFLVVEKTGANTEWVARQLARAAGVAPVAVGFAGLKDRHAVTRQAFTVHVGNRTEPDWPALAIPGVQVVAATRHARKLKRGAHRGNRFRIRLRDVAGDRAAIVARCDAVAAHGVPNYFGEQRFGRDGGNVDLARQLFGGTRLPREQRGIVVSAARSELFNAVLARRVADASWNHALDGDVFMLDGTHSIFGPEAPDDALRARVAAFDVHPTGPMWGCGELRSTLAVAALEREVAHAQADLAGGLEREGLEQERRALRLRAGELVAGWEGPGTLVFEFVLPGGAFATTVLREVVDWS
jgi:tRNA pseudouridine13 synthase